MLHSFEGESQASLRQLASEVLEPGLTQRTRARLQLLLEALPQQEARISSLFRDAEIEASPSSPSPESDATLAPESLLSYFTLIHRDFSWSPEVDEVEQAMVALLAVLPAGFKLGRSLFLGAGTARLAWDLGLRLNETATILALDINPLPFLVSARLLSDKTLKLFEIPGHPLRSNFAAVERTFTPPSAVPEGLQLLFADGLNPPVAHGCWDTVVTPWFLDQVPKNLVDMLPVIRSLLAPGGSWLHTGPLVYNPNHTQAVHRYSGDEFLKLVEGAGFQVSKASYESVSYLASPISSQSRREYVLNLHATKLEGGPEVLDASPPWLKEEGNLLPIPSPQGISSFEGPHPMVTTVARLVDGKRSTRDIAVELIESGRLANDGNAEAAVRTCLHIIKKALVS